MKIETQYAKATRWLRQYLAEHEGTAYVLDVIKDGKNNGFSESVIYAVKDGLKVIVRRQGFGRGGRWFWELNDNLSNKGAQL